MPIPDLCRLRSRRLDQGIDFHTVNRKSLTGGSKHRVGELTLRRAVVMQVAGEVKTVHSSKPLALDARLLEVLKAHEQRSEYIEETDWVFASPDLNGKKPRSYICFYGKPGRAWQDAGSSTSHHTASVIAIAQWLDESGTPISVQQRAMRHGDIRVTMNIYGDPVSDALRDARSKIAEAGYQSVTDQKCELSS